MTIEEIEKMFLTQPDCCELEVMEMKKNKNGFEIQLKFEGECYLETPPKARIEKIERINHNMYITYILAV